MDISELKRSGIQQLLLCLTFFVKYYASFLLSGRVNINSVPTPSVLMTLIFSPCAWIISFTMERPRPVPRLSFPRERSLLESLPDLRDAILWNAYSGVFYRDEYLFVPDARLYLDT